jgi:UDP-3-O-[3-hydroxymyristoyl] glucosamine N-acyltransferase
MTSFRSALNVLVEENPGLEISEVNVDYIDSVCRTGFVWTSLPRTLALAANRKYIEIARSNQNVCAIVLPDDLDVKDWSRGIIKCNHASDLFYIIHNSAVHEYLMNDCISEKKLYVKKSARIDPSAIIESGVYIDDNVEVRAGAIIKNGTTIGPNTVIEERVTIGGDGLFAKTLLGKKKHVRHFGGVHIGSDCYIHSGTNIAKSVNSGECTIVGNRVHIGVLSVIGHDCRIGDDTVVSSGVIIAGRAKIGSKCWIGAGAKLSNEVTVYDSADIKIGAVVIADIESGKQVSGNFAINHPRNIKNWLRNKNA